MNMKIVFLDIDGVLNNACTHEPYCTEKGKINVPVDPACVARLNRLLAETGAKVVVSSSWRLFADLPELAAVLASKGVVADIIGATPDLANDALWLEQWTAAEGREFPYDELDRGHEIAEWMRGRDDVDEFAILDDCSDMAHLKNRLVLTHPCDGLDDPDVERAKHFLSGGY